MPVDANTIPNASRHRGSNWLTWAAFALAVVAVFACNPSLRISITCVLLAVVCSIAAASIAKLRYGKIGAFTGSISALSLLLLLVMLLLPTLGRARPAANRIKCASNMRQIGIAIVEYAKLDPNGNMPPDLATLATAFTDDLLSADVFIDPQPNFRSEKPTTSPAEPSWQIKIIPGTKHCDYFYVYSQTRLAALAPQTVVLIEPLDAHENAGINVLLADGSVEWEPIDQARKIYGRIFGGENPPR